MVTLQIKDDELQTLYYLLVNTFYHCIPVDDFHYVNDTMITFENKEYKAIQDLKAKVAKKYLKYWR